MTYFLLACLLAISGAVTATKIEVSPNCSDSHCVNMSNLVIPSSDSVEIVLLSGTHTLNSLSLGSRLSASLVGSSESTIVTCSPSSFSFSANIDIDQVAAVTIKNIHFNGCKINLKRCRNASILQSKFLGSRISLERCWDTSILGSKFMNTTNDAAMEIRNSFNITISKSVFSGHLNSYISFSQNTGLQLTEIDFSQNSAGHRYFLYFSNKQNIQMSNCRFTENTLSLIEINDGISINNCTFSQNRISSRGILLKVGGRDGAVLSGTHFIGNVLSSYATLIEVSHFVGVISCCVFQNNSFDSYGKIIEMEYSTVYITNTTFTRNSLTRHGNIIYSESFYRNRITVISSHFAHNNLLFSGRVIYGNPMIIASEFSNNRFFHPRTINSGNCSRVDNETRNWSPFCAQFAIGRDGLCSAQTCNECRSPNVSVALEFSQISISENIRHSHYAVQVCAVASNILWAVEFVLEPVNGTAIEDEDFKVLSLSERSHEFSISEGHQSRCTYFEILDDERKEETEYFTVKLLSNDPTVVITNGETTVSIIDDDRDLTSITTNNYRAITTPTEATTKDEMTTVMPNTDDKQTPTTGSLTAEEINNYSGITTPTAKTTKDETTIMMPTTNDNQIPTTGSLIEINKTVLVECGVYVRPVTFASIPKNDVTSLKESIVQAFPRLEQQHIGLLKVKSDEFGGKYIDITDTSMMIESKSYMKVILFTKFDGVCTI